MWRSTFAGSFGSADHETRKTTDAANPTGVGLFYANFGNETVRSVKYYFKQHQKPFNEQSVKIESFR
jgi:hypothetical protein